MTGGYCIHVRGDGWGEKNSLYRRLKSTIKRE
nr:MAG TPA: hypothetical protein [Caudoviricetes sp.]